jgi:hypothetical protein
MPTRSVFGYLWIQRFTHPGVIWQAWAITPNQQVGTVVWERGR